jgi:hypothetical protein
MPSVFEQSWPLLVAALVVFLVVGTWRAVLPEKNRWWQWCIPLAVVLLALGLDMAVATDHEQILSLSQKLIHAVAAEDIDDIDRLLAPDYRDSLHRDRDAFLSHVRSGLTHSPVHKLTRLNREIESLNAPEASLTMETILVFEKESRIASLYRQQFFASVRLHLIKSSRRVWLLQRLDLLTIDRQPMGWGQIPGQVW